MGVSQSITNGLMGRCEMVWTTAGTNRVCSRCLALKDTVVGYTDEVGVTLPPLHPRCRCAIMYREVDKPKTVRPTNGNAGVDNFKFDPQRFNDEARIRNALQEKMAELRIKGELKYPPPVMDLSSFVFDAEHTQGDKHPHNVTEEEARRFIVEAYFAIIKYKGNSYNYYGREGAAFVRKDLQTIRTAFKREEYDENALNMVEVYENEFKQQ